MPTHRFRRGRIEDQEKFESVYQTESPQLSSCADRTATGGITKGAFVFESLKTLGDSLGPLANFLQVVGFIGVPSLGALAIWLFKERNALQLSQEQLLDLVNGYLISDDLKPGSRAELLVP